MLFILFRHLRHFPNVTTIKVVAETVRAAVVSVMETVMRELW